MTEIAIRQPAEVATASDAVDVDSWVTVVQEISKLASIICDTDFVPKAYRGNAPATAAAILAGRELGLPPMTALRHVQLVEGSPSLSAEYKRARVLSKGHEFDVLEATSETCTVAGRRRGAGGSGGSRLVITYTIEDARRARLIKDRGAWTTRPKRMLFARAGTELCDFLFADVTNGLPTTELLDQDGDGVSGYDEQPARPSGRVTAAEITARPSAPQNASPAVRQVAPVPADPHTPPAEPAGEAPDDTDYDSPGTVIPPQLTAIWTLLTSVYGFTHDEKDQARAVCAYIIGGDLDSTKDMSKNEARKVLDTLAGWRQAADEQGIEPKDYLIDVMVAGQVAGDA